MSAFEAPRVPDEEPKSHGRRSKHWGQITRQRIKLVFSLTPNHNPSTLSGERSQEVTSLCETSRD